MRHGAPAAMIGACPERGQRRNEEDPTVNLSLHPSIAYALAAERHGQFLTEAQQARRLIQLDQVRDRDTAAVRVVRAIRVTVMTAAARMESWSARRRLHPWSRLGQA